MKSSPGFSLVEVTLAMGLVSFSLVGLMGMLPVGLSNFREAMEIQTQARIAQQIAAEFQLMPFSEVSGGSYQNGFPRHYDEEGTSVTATEAIYTVTAEAPAAMELPGSAANADMRLLTFGIRKKTSPKAAEAFSLVASNTGR